MNYLRTRLVHMAAKVSDKGVSALCFMEPRAIDTAKASWTMTERFVSCRKCRSVLNKQAKKTAESQNIPSLDRTSPETVQDK